MFSAGGWDEKGEVLLGWFGGAGVAGERDGGVGKEKRKAKVPENG